MIKRAAGRSPIAFAAFALLLSVNSLAQSPGQPMRLVVPFPPGGTADLLGRLVAQRLGDALKTTVVIDNRVGAGGSVGAEVVARRPPMVRPCCSATPPHTRSTNGSTSASATTRSRTSRRSRRSPTCR